MCVELMDDDADLGLRGGEPSHETLIEWYNTWRCNTYIPTLLTPKQLSKLSKLLRKDKRKRGKITALGKRTRGKLTLDHVTSKRRKTKAISTGGLAPRKQLFWNLF